MLELHARHHGSMNRARAFHSSPGEENAGKQAKLVAAGTPAQCRDEIGSARANPSGTRSIAHGSPENIALALLKRGPICDDYPVRMAPGTGSA